MYNILRMIFAGERLDDTHRTVPLCIEREFDLEESVEWCFRPGLRKDLGHPQRAYYSFALVATMLTEDVNFLFTVPNGDGTFARSRLLQSDDFPSDGIDFVSADRFMSNVAGRLIPQPFMEPLGVILHASPSSLQAVQCLADTLFLLDQPQRDVRFSPVYRRVLGPAYRLPSRRRVYGLHQFIEREWQIERWRRQRDSIDPRARRKILRAHAPDLRPNDIFLNV